MSAELYVPPAFRKTFKGKKLYYFVDATTALPTATRVSWTVRHTGQWPHVLLETFANLFSAAISVFEASPSQRTKAFELIQLESGLATSDFDFAAFDWGATHVEPDRLDLSSVGPAIMQRVNANCVFEPCSARHVADYERALKGKAAFTFDQWSLQALQKGEAHFTFLYCPPVVPDKPIEPDVVAASTVLHWLSTLGPVALISGAPGLLWVTQHSDSGTYNESASSHLGYTIQGNAWCLSTTPVFPTKEHGARADSRREAPANRAKRGRGRGGRRGA